MAIHPILIHPPHCVVGVIGGGQLGRMLALAARRMGVRTAIWTGGLEAPAVEVADEVIDLPFDDPAGARTFLRGGPPWPPWSLRTSRSPRWKRWPRDPAASLARGVGICQNREREKISSRKRHPCTRFHVVSNAGELAAAMRELAGPAVLKTADFGYDGKGQIKLKGNEDPEVPTRQRLPRPEGRPGAGDRQAAKSLAAGNRHQTLLGVTGSGKTFTMANLIARHGKPTLVMSHNKTLAAQLYSEFKNFFPHNAVEYFVSYFDYYQPEAYIPRSDTYIEKDSSINEEIERLRLSTMGSLLTRQDTIVVASVSCIYGLGSPEDYENMMVPVWTGQKLTREEFPQLAGRHALRAQRHRLRPRQVPRPRRCGRSPPGLPR
jgi:hypothetical protein